MNQLISIIIPVYNTGHYLKKCLDSILNQTYQDFEVILVNDGSDDRTTLAILDEYKNKPKIKYFEKENEGIPKTRNFALSKVNGYYIMFVDSDDYIEAIMLEKMYQTIVTTGSDIVGCAYSVIYPHFKGVWSKNIFKTYHKKEVLKALTSNTIINNYLWAKLYKASLFKGLSFDSNYPGFEDVMFMPSIYNRINKLTMIKGRYYNYVMRKGSYTNSMNNKKVMDMFKAFKAQEDLLNQLDNGHYRNDFNYYRNELVYLMNVISNKDRHKIDLTYDDSKISLPLRTFSHLLRRIVKMKEVK